MVVPPFHTPKWSFLVGVFPWVCWVITTILGFTPGIFAYMNGGISWGAGRKNWHLSSWPSTRRWGPLRWRVPQQLSRSRSRCHKWWDSTVDWLVSIAIPKMVGFPPKSSILVGVFRYKPLASTGGFPKMVMFSPQNHPLKNRGFPLFSPSIFGVPLFLETPTRLAKN